MSPRTLSIGGATYDLFVRTGADLQKEKNEQSIHLPIGAKIHVDQVIETCGGGASNTSVGLQRLGCQSHFSGIVGSDQWGEALLKNFKKEGVDTSSMTIVENETTSFSIILSAKTGERVILYDPGTNAHLHDMNFDREKTGGMDWLYLNHIHESSCVIEDDIVALVREKKIGLTWNPGGCHLKTGIKQKSNQELLSVTKLLLLNKEEALQFTDETSIEKAIEVLLKAGAGIVCITDGKNGSTASDGKDTVHCPVMQDAPVVDTTGAGDAFGTGATWACLQGFDLKRMLQAGTINATSVVGVIGAEAGLLTDTEMNNRLQHTSPNAHV